MHHIMMLHGFKRLWSSLLFTGSIISALLTSVYSRIIFYISSPMLVVFSESAVKLLAPVLPGSVLLCSLSGHEVVYNWNKVFISFILNKIVRFNVWYDTMVGYCAKWVQVIVSLQQWEILKLYTSIGYLRPNRPSCFIQVLWFSFVPAFRYRLKLKLHQSSISKTDCQHVWFRRWHPIPWL